MQLEGGMKPDEQSMVERVKNLRHALNLFTLALFGNASGDFIPV